MWYIINNVILLSHKKGGILASVTMWKDPECIVLSKISQSWKDKYCIIPFVCGI